MSQRAALLIVVGLGMGLGAPVACGGIAGESKRSKDSDPSGKDAGSGGKIATGSGGAIATGSGGAIATGSGGARVNAGTGGQSGAGGSGTGGSASTVSIRFSVEGAFCSHGCLGPGVEIEDAAGQSVDYFPGCGRASCDTCSPIPCPSIPCLPDDVVTQGVRDWDGTHYVDSTCGAGTPCTGIAPVEPGQYIAKFCATPGKMIDANGVRECVPSAPEQCTSVPFEFPSAVSVTGTLRDFADGG